MIPGAALEAAFESMYGPSPSNPSDSVDAHLLKELRKALEAAAPHMLAEALAVVADEFAARLPDGTGNGRAYNSYQVAHILRAKAEEMSAKQVAETAH